jgi:uncharacterized protein YdhG (YjbR/CyaY superfamily)
MKTDFTSIDEYIAACPEQSQESLREIRSAVRAAVPEAQEKISYQIGAFELNGKGLLAFAGWKRHVSLYPTPSGDEVFNREIASYTSGKGTLRFPLDKPLPMKLIGKAIELYVAENLKRSGLSKR